MPQRKRAREERGKELTQAEGDVGSRKEGRPTCVKATSKDTHKAKEELPGAHLRDEDQGRDS